MAYEMDTTIDGIIRTALRREYARLRAELKGKDAKDGLERHRDVLRALYLEAEAAIQDRKDRMAEIATALREFERQDDA